MGLLSYLPSLLYELSMRLSYLPSLLYKVSMGLSYLPSWLYKGVNFVLALGNALLEDDKVFHLVRPADELDEIKSKRGSMKDKSMTKAITEIYLTRLLSVKVPRLSRARLSLPLLSTVSLIDFLGFVLLFFVLPLYLSSHHFF